jgi:hypothetical protein
MSDEVYDEDPTKEEKKLKIAYMGLILSTDVC